MLVLTDSIELFMDQAYLSHEGVQVTIASLYPLDLLRRPFELKDSLPEAYVGCLELQLVRSFSSSFVGVLLNGKHDVDGAGLQLIFEFHLD